MAISRRNFLKFAGLGAGSMVVASKAEAESAPAAEVDAGSHPSMLYDATLCVGCHACQSGCRNWNDTTPEVSANGLYDAPTDLSADTWTVIQLYQENHPQPAEEETQWSFVKRNCMHCLDPACVSACTVGALQKSAEGPIIYDTERCFGCRYCMIACPYHVPRYQWDTTTPLVQKCTFCFGYVQSDDATVDPKNRLAQGLPPACVASCPTGALVWGPREKTLAEAHNRIDATPGKYYEDRVYGEHEAGGALQLILSEVLTRNWDCPHSHPNPCLNSPKPPRFRFRPSGSGLAALQPRSTNGAAAMRTEPKRRTGGRGGDNMTTSAMETTQTTIVACRHDHPGDFGDHRQRSPQ